MGTIDDTIQKIDNYIKTIIQDMINFRSKRLEASQKVLDKLKALMEATTYLYRLGDMYDKAIKIETDTLKQYDITRPRLKLRYIGTKTTLFYNGYYVDVPSVPIFKYEPYKPEKLSVEMGTEAIRRNLAIKLPLDTNVAEPPDLENAYGKYYFLDYIGWSHDYLTWTIFTGKKITLMGMIMEINVIDTYMYYIFQRKLTIDGTQYLFWINVNFGKVVAKTTTVTGTEVTDVEYPCTLFELATEYSGNCSFIVFGNEYTRGVQSDSVYVRDVLMVYFDDSAIMYLLR